MFVREDRNRWTWCWLHGIYLWLYLAPWWSGTAEGTDASAIQIHLSSTHKINISFLFPVIFDISFGSTPPPRVDLRLGSFFPSVGLMGAGAEQRRPPLSAAHSPHLRRHCVTIARVRRSCSAPLVFSTVRNDSPRKPPLQTGCWSTISRLLVLCTCNLTGSPARAQWAAILSLGRRGQSVLSARFGTRSLKLLLEYSLLCRLIFFCWWSINDHDWTQIFTWLAVVYSKDTTSNFRHGNIFTLFSHEPLHTVTKR